MRAGEAVFIDSGAWIALALTRDSFHGQAVDTWNQVIGAGARLYTSVPVVLETFTFLDRNTSRDVAIDWKDSLESTRSLQILDCTASDIIPEAGLFRIRAARRRITGFSVHRFRNNHRLFRKANRSSSGR